MSDNVSSECHCSTDPQSSSKCSSARPLPLQLLEAYLNSKQPWYDGWVNRVTINNYCLLTLLKVSWVTAEKTVRRWAVFADCCYFKDGTADTEAPVISDAALFSFLHFKTQLWEKWDFFLANIGTLYLCLSVLCLCVCMRTSKKVPLEDWKMHVIVKRGFAQQNNG